VYNSENKRTRISKSPLCAVRLHKKPWGRESCYTGKLTALIPTPPTLYMLKLSLRCDQSQFRSHVPTPMVDIFYTQKISKMLMGMHIVHDRG